MYVKQRREGIIRDSSRSIRRVIFSTLAISEAII